MGGLLAKIVLFNILMLANEFGVVKSLINRIVGGKHIPIRFAPYQVSVAFQGSHICGGALIKDNLVLSAAHCFVTHDKTESPTCFSAYAGIEIIRYSGSDQHVNVKQIIIHELYDPDSPNADIALLKLNEPFKLNENIGLISLSDRVPKTGEKCLVTGWGETKMKNVGKALMGVYLPIFDWHECKKIHPEITRKNVCAGYLKGGKDSCKGDSGGPLVYKRKIVGIVSWGIGCARDSMPGVYTSVPAYNEWIQVNGLSEINETTNESCESDIASSNESIQHNGCALFILFRMTMFIIFQYNSSLL